MIWLALLSVSLLCAMWLVAPLFAAPKALDSQTEAGAYLEEIEHLDTGPEALARKTQLERRVIAASQIAVLPKAPFKVLGAIIVTIIVAGSAGIYATIGRPNLVADTQTAQVMPEPSLEDMAQKLKARLEETPESVEGWILYARTLMTLENFDEALNAYEMALKLAPDNSTVFVEVESAKNFIGQREIAMEMSAQDRAAMIEGMVSNLATKLADNPEDREGWIRLLTSRRVLGQSDQAQNDIAAMKAHYADRPQIAQDILSAVQGPDEP